MIPAIIAILIVLYALTTYLVLKKSRPLEIVTAGDINRENSMLEGRQFAALPIFLDGFKPISRQKYKRYAVDGDCLNVRKISNGDVVFCSLFKSNEVENLMPGQILLIRITKECPKKGQLKLREFYSYLPDQPDCIQTIKYMNNKPVMSTPHLKVDVLGIVNKVSSLRH